MADKKATVRQALEGDTTLMAVLTGGVFDASELPRSGMTANNLPRDANDLIEPCAVLKWTSQTTMPGPREAVRGFLEIYFYADTYYDKIDAAARRTWVLLDRAYFGHTNNEGLMWLNWTGDLGEMYDDELEAVMDRSRYEVVQTRKTT